MKAVRQTAILASSAAVLLFAVAGCKQEPAPKVEPPRPVRTVVVEPRPVEGALVLPAELKPRIESRYGFRVGGKVAQRLVAVGDRVKQGQEMARLDPQDVRPAIDAARASLAAARTDAQLAAADLDRQKNLRERNFVSQASLERQQAVLDAARARVEAAQAQLKQATNAGDFQVLRADTAGHVVAVEAEAGQVVGAGQTVVRIARAGEIEAAFNVPEADVAAVRTGARWRVVVEAAGKRVLEGRVREISPVADPASRTWPVRLTLSGDLAGIELGMTATAVLASSGGSAFIVPVSAIHSTDARPRVWVVDPATSTVRAVPVTTAGLTGESVRIASGLQAGDRVVTAGANLLAEGRKVRLLDTEGGAR